MVYTAIGNRSIKLLSLSKTMLGQYHTSYFSKYHSAHLIKNGKIESVDLLASALKEALTQAKPNPIVDKDFFLILPQEMFIFTRYSIPGDISDAAIISFVKDKLRADLQIDIEELFYDFIVTKNDEGCIVLFYGLEKDKYSNLEQTFSLLGLTVKNIIPDTLSYFKLFNKTLLPEKQEKVAYVSYQEQESFAFLYDAQGLLSDKMITLDDEVVVSLKKEITDLSENQKITLNRIILSGEKSKDIRQDYFTKDVGVWTNPIDKIIQNYYADYIKQLLPTQGEEFSPLLYASNLGGFIFECEKDQFKPLSQNGNIRVSKSNSSKPSISLPSFSLFSRRDIGIFLVSFLLSFGIIYGALKANIFIKKSPAPSVSTTKNSVSPIVPTVKPSPSLQREEIKVKILNGTGISGKAGEYSTILKDKKYSEVLSGNADSFDVEITEIQAKKTKSEAVDLIKEDLEDFLKIGKTSVLDETEAADVVIIIGLDSVSPTPTSSE